MNACDNRVVVTGLGVLAPNAHGLEAFTKALKNGNSGISFHEHLAELKFGCQVGGIPDGVEELQTKYLTEEELFAMNANMVYAAIAAIDAWTDAGLELPEDVAEADWDTGGIITAAASNAYTDSPTAEHASPSGPIAAR